MNLFENLTFVNETKNVINGKFSVRVYRSDLDEKRYRYHLGYPQEFLLEPIRIILETSAYFGEAHHDFIDSFYIYWLPISRLKAISPPYNELNNYVVDTIKYYNQILKILNS